MLFQNCGPALHTSSSGGGTALLNSNGMQTVFKCDPNADTSPQPARRLTRYEYTQSVLLLLSGLSTSDQNSIKAALSNEFMAVPDDSGAKFDSDDQGISESHTTAYFTVAKAFAGSIVNSSTRLKAFFGSCASATTAPTLACVKTFLTNQGTRILRRPLTDAEQNQMYSDMGGQWKLLLTRLLMHPHFLFQMELDGADVKQNTLKISAYELASRISFHVVKQAPDAFLLAKAADGSLLQKDVIQAEIARLISTYPQQAAYSVDKFFEGWMAFNYVAHPVVGATAAEKAFVAGKSLTRNSLLNELIQMSRYYMNQGKGSFEDLFLSPYSFATDADLASIYGVTTYNPATQAMVAFPNGQRSGLLNRAAYLVSGNIETSPIIRGLRVRRQFLCEELDPPPTNIASMVRDPVFDPTLSTRERFHRQTESPACIGCHVAINPLGFALENFDGFGRYRTLENVYDSQTGQLLNQIPVDPNVQPLISLQDSRSISSSDEFHRLMAEGGKARGCLVQNFYRYIYHEQPHKTADSCALLEMDELASSPEGLRKLFYEIPLRDSFQYRRVR